jgi:hypothetical protein
MTSKQLMLSFAILATAMQLWAIDAEGWLAVWTVAKPLVILIVVLYVSLALSYMLTMWTIAFFLRRLIGAAMKGQDL